MPRPASWAAVTPARDSASRATASWPSQICSGSCSTSPGAGYRCGSSCCADAIAAPPASNTIAREDVVPWSSASTYRAGECKVRRPTSDDAGAGGPAHALRRHGPQALRGLLGCDIPLRLGHQLVADHELAHPRAEQWRVEVRVQLPVVGRTFSEGRLVP